MNIYLGVFNMCMQFCTFPPCLLLRSWSIQLYCWNLKNNFPWILPMLNTFKSGISPSRIPCSNIFSHILSFFVHRTKIDITDFFLFVLSQSVNWKIQNFLFKSLYKPFLSIHMNHINLFFTVSLLSLTFNYVSRIFLTIR